MDSAIVVNSLLIAVVLVASYTDFRRRRVPNWLTGPAVVAGLAVGAWAAGLDGFLAALGGGLLGLGLLLIPFMLRGMGAGDVKLLAAVGALGGPHFVLVAALYMALVGGAMAVLALAWRRRLLATLVELAVTWRLLSPEDRSASRVRLPYAPAIAAGALLAMFVGW